MSNTNFDEYLKTFFENELYFLSSPDLQQKAWNGVRGEQFAISLLVFFESWSVIEKNRDKFKISNSLFMEIKQLFEMIKAFQDDRRLAKNTSILGGYGMEADPEKSLQIFI